MSNSVYGKTINSERDISRVINNSAYSKIIKEKTNTKKYQSYKNQSLEWKWNKKIFYFIIKQKELLFYNTFIKKPKITGLKNIKLLHEFIFYDKLNIYEISKAFGWYTRTYKVEIIDLKDPSAQLEASKSSIKNLVKGLSDEMKGFKYQITVKVLLRKDKQNRDIEFALVYFNSTPKTVINSNMTLANLFKKFCTESAIGLIKNLVG